MVMLVSVISIAKYSSFITITMMVYAQEHKQYEYRSQGISV